MTVETITMRRASLAFGLFVMAWAAAPLPVLGAEGAGPIPAAQARIQREGNLLSDGAFSFWTTGALGDYFVATENVTVKVKVIASGRELAGQAPRVAIDIAPADGETTEVARFDVTGKAPQEYVAEFPVARGFFALELRHTNRVAGDAPGDMRHLFVRSFAVEGARRAECGPAEWVFFHGGKDAGPQPARREMAGGETRVVETKALRVVIVPSAATWSAEERASGQVFEGIHPVFNLGGATVDFADYQNACAIRRVVSRELGDCAEVELRYRKPGGVGVTYRLLIGEQAPDVIAQVDFANDTGRTLAVNRVASMAIPRASLGGRAADWSALTDGNRNSDPCQLATVSDARGLEGWWYLAVKNGVTGRSALLGNLTNNKGLGRFLLSADGADAMRMVAYNDYESILMPPGARVTGELTLLNFGRRGTDSLERFGDLIAKAHGIDLRRRHPIDPDDPAIASLFVMYNVYGSAIIRDFPYKHDKSRFEKAYMDPAWVEANRKKVVELGLGEYGYGDAGRGHVRGAPSPLARRYGQVDFWAKGVEQTGREHPEFYADGRIDFSNPATLAFERLRVAQAFSDPRLILRYNWDFTERWSRLPGQFDPFMTSAETYRAAMGLWREAALKRAAGSYSFVWMNRVGLNYDRVDVIHIGHDSDQGYYGPGCTVTHGLSRQIGGRYFYNGRVWWNSPDSFHVYAGGLYSYAQAKVHASLCSLAGNLVHLGEPFCDEEIPADRLDIIRRVTPTTADVSQAVDVFEHNPARLWNMPVKRSFGQWNIVGLFNVDFDEAHAAITQSIGCEDLGLSADKEYLVYEFWSQRFLGAVKGGFTRTLSGPDCEVFAIVEKSDHPALISTNRHVRQMAYDVHGLTWHGATRELAGASRVVKGDPYELRVFVPEGFAFDHAVCGELKTTARQDGELLLVKVVPSESGDLSWSIRFK